MFTLSLSLIPHPALTMDNNGDLYVSEQKKNEVTRCRTGEEKGTIITGENGKGYQPNQLNGPSFLFVDKDHSVYVSDSSNRRVMKWIKNAKEGIVVDGQGEEDSLKQLSNPQEVFANQ